MEPQLCSTIQELTKSAQDRASDPLLWALQVSSCLRNHGIALPSSQLANWLVSYIFWDNNVPIVWKFLEKALILRIVPPICVLSLLRIRVLPSRDFEPAAYRLYLELLNRHAFRFDYRYEETNSDLLAFSLDSVPRVSKEKGHGILVVEFVFSAVWHLVEASIEDEALDPSCDIKEANNEKRYSNLCRSNTVLGLEILKKFIQDEVTSQIIRLTRHNSPLLFARFSERIHLLEKKISWTIPSFDSNFFGNRKTNRCNNGISPSADWLPLDLALEDAVDGYRINATSAIDQVIGLVKTLKAYNNVKWHDCFLALWIAALRLVQRGREPMEGPIPCLDARLCVLLSIVPLAISDLIEEDDARAESLVLSLKRLGDYRELLTPPQSVSSLANHSAAKAASFSSGNLRHLIVEACISRKLIDTSAYSWPGYANRIPNQSTDSNTDNVWCCFMSGDSLDSETTNLLASNPASRLEEIEKVYKLAIDGTVDQKIYASTVLCGSSLLRGWNIQEHAADFIIRLLCALFPDVHLESRALILNVLLVGISTVDCIQIFSMLGLVPHLACSLMPICEAFGSLASDGKTEAHDVFSNAFVLLLMLWRFNHSPLDHGKGDVPTVGSQLTPEYLLLVRNSYLVADETARRRRRRLSALATESNPEPVFMDSYPKLKAWYRQHQRCIASTVSDTARTSSVERVVDLLLDDVFRKRGTRFQCQGLAAWELLEAVPFVVHAALTACEHGRLVPRELATGLKCLADFLPASLATIVSVLSAEVTRGIWKAVPMNGTDWPSPAANVAVVEHHMKHILSSTGVPIPPPLLGGSAPATLPLPLAAFVSLTITYKIDKQSKRFLNLAGPTLESLAAGCPWPSMPIVASLWTLKAKKWLRFLVFCASRTVFLNDTDAVFRLLGTCFAAALNLGSAGVSTNGGVGPLLGHGFPSDSSVAPGMIYLRASSDIRDVVSIAGMIIRILVRSTEELASARHVSLASVTASVEQSASLGASFVWLSGGMALVQSLFKETLPSWFLTVHDRGEEPGAAVRMLRGYALACFAVMCGAFTIGADSLGNGSKRRRKVVGVHMEFIADALDGTVSLGCDWTTWRSYVCGFVKCMVMCTPSWVSEVDPEILKRVSGSLRKFNEREAALALLTLGGSCTMDSAALFIIENR